MPTHTGMNTGRDHPRVCGEHLEVGTPFRHTLGSSPRMRGTPEDLPEDSFVLGIIPAYAGNTRIVSSPFRRIWDHPRVCGEHETLPHVQLDIEGSSPRMRGTPAITPPSVRLTGIIPAYAGNTNSVSHTIGTSGDHPRVCGEHHGAESDSEGLEGSSPRMRGTPAPRTGISRPTGIIPAYAGNTCACSRPRSRRRDHPRVCGEHLGISCRQDRRPGIIPAYAGNTSECPYHRWYSWDHPRVCGEHRRRKSYQCSGGGSSPRMRGTLEIGFAPVFPRGIIPAYAGNTYWKLHELYVRRDHPRVCGEHGDNDGESIEDLGSSPRMRGTLSHDGCFGVLRGIIPAYAGNTYWKLHELYVRRDHPRVCGEHGDNDGESIEDLGSSPRMRGTQCPLI